MISQHWFKYWLGCLSQSWPRSMLSFGITRPQWVTKSFISNNLRVKVISRHRFASCLTQSNCRLETTKTYGKHYANIANRCLGARPWQGLANALRPIGDEVEVVWSIRSLHRQQRNLISKKREKIMFTAVCAKLMTIHFSKMSCTGPGYILGSGENHLKSS